MKKLHTLMVAYRRPIELMTSCGLFLRQTNPNWDLKIIHDGVPPKQVSDIMNLFGDERIKFNYSKTRNSFWGHPNRKKMLEDLVCEDTDFVLMTNDDNIIVPNFIEQMLGVTTEKTGFVMCDMVHSYCFYDYFKTQLKVGFIDMGAFIVRADVAKAVGFNHINEFVADGLYAVECGTYCVEHNLDILHIEKPLFIHC
jgi:hypothetical protein